MCEKVFERKQTSISLRPFSIEDEDYDDEKESSTVCK